MIDRIIHEAEWIKSKIIPMCEIHSFNQSVVRLLPMTGEFYNWQTLFFVTQQHCRKTAPPHPCPLKMFGLYLRVKNIILKGNSEQYSTCVCLGVLPWSDCSSRHADDLGVIHCSAQDVLCVSVVSIRVWTVCHSTVHPLLVEVSGLMN